MTVDGSRWVLRTALLGPAAILLVAGALGQDPVGISSDEPLHRQAGIRLLRYYGTLGEDGSVLTLRDTRYYGGLFDLAGALLERALPGTPWHLPRHALSLFCGALGVVYASRIAARFGGWPAALLAGLVLVLTPRWSGHALFNPKDIPFAAAYAAATWYLVRLADELPGPRRSSWIGFAVASGCALGVRVAGLLPPALLAAVVGLHLAVRARRPPGRAGLARDGAVLAGRWLAATAAAVALGIAAWPYLQADPLHRLAEVLRYNSDFPHPVPLWFGGRSLPPGGAGWRYLPVWLAIGLPVGLQAGALLGCARAALGRRAERPRPEAVAALLLAAFFPILYAMARQSTLYNGLRHFLFVLPPLAALAGWGWHGAIVALRRAPARWALVAVLALALLEPLVWMVRAHPLGYVYFSPLGGGIARLGTRYEADYWRMHLGPLCRKLDETLERMPGRRPLILGIQRSQHLRLRLAPLLREPARLVLVEPDDPRAQLVAVLGGPCASRPELERCYFVLRAVADQRPFLVVEKRPSFDEPPAAPQRRRRRRPAAG